MSEKKHTKISLKNIFPIPLYHFQSQFSIMGLRNAILQYNNPINDVYIGLEWRPHISYNLTDYLNYNFVALSPSEAPVASEIVRELGRFRISLDANTAQKFP